MVLFRAPANITKENLTPSQKNIPQELKKSKKNCKNRPSKDLLYINRWKRVHKNKEKNRLKCNAMQILSHKRTRV
jgi:hypothetical protein